MYDTLRQPARRARLVLTATVLTVGTAIATVTSAGAARPAHDQAMSAYCAYLYQELRTAPSGQKPLILQEIRENCIGNGAGD